MSNAVNAPIVYSFAVNALRSISHVTGLNEVECLFETTADAGRFQPLDLRRTYTTRTKLLR